MRALRTLDEGDIAEAYLQGDIDIEGDMLRPFEIRGSMGDRHYALTAWRFLQPPTPRCRCARLRACCASG